MKLLIAVLITITIFLMGCNFPIPNDETIMQQIDEYHKSIDYSCNVDADCEIKNAGDCCSIYAMRCTNKNAQVNPDYLNGLCDSVEGSRMCPAIGIMPIDYCECKDNRCFAKRHGPI